MSIMTVNGLRAEINTPTALRGKELHSLPPHQQIPAHVVDEYPACPDIWEHGSDKASSYFVSLKAGQGMWFDFTQNQFRTHHVAVVISVQGINPVTGKPITELCLIQHQKQCPVHNIDFQQDRYCPQCKYKWPAQNYIATTTCQPLWLDGFRNEDGEVRQYIISEEQARGIAKQIEDKDPKFKRVWAIGFAFYLSKDPKPIPPASPLRSAMSLFDGYSKGSSMCPGAASMEHDSLDMKDDGLDYEMTSSSGPKWLTTTSPNHPPGIPKIVSVDYPSQSAGAPKNLSTYSCSAIQSTSVSVPEAVRQRKSVLKRVRTSGVMSTQAPVEKVVETKKLEVGAGARIRQEVGVDPNPINFWQETPVGMIYVNFTSEETLQQILGAGKREDKAEGPLDGMKVGN